jgi:phosphatidylglycerophosphate synthase
MASRRFVLVNLIARLGIAAIAVGLWVALGAGDRGWLYAAALVANLALDLAGVYLARRLGEQPRSWFVADLLVAKAIYVIVFVALAAEQRLPAWLALPMIVRDVVLVLGAVWARARTGRFPLPTGHERWPTQLFILVLAVYVAGVLWIGPALLLLFGLLLTRLPGFWLRWCMLLDPEAYQPTGQGGGRQRHAAQATPSLLKAVLRRPASWLTVAALPVALLATAMAGVWLARSRPGLFATGFDPMAALIGPGDWQGLMNAGNALIVYLCLLPAFLVLSGLIAVHLREMMVRLGVIQVADPSLTRPGAVAAGLAAVVTALCLVAYAAFGRAVFGPSPASAPDRLLDWYIGWWLFPLNGLLLSLVGMSYPSRFPHETVLERLQLSGASLSTPSIALVMGELLGLFSLKQGGVAVAAMLLFMAVMFQWRRGPSAPR